MKKILGILITSLFVTLNIINAVQAANIYRVYNKLENKTYYLTLGSVRFISEEYYVFALLKDNKPYCILDGELNRKNQLIGGRCTEYSAALKYYMSEGRINITPYEYGWRENKQNTFFNEARSIRANKTSQGFMLATPQILEKVNEY